MEDKEYLLNGDLQLIAERLGASANHVRLVSQGNRKNKRIEDAIKGLIVIRKRELEAVIKGFETLKVDEVSQPAQIPDKIIWAGSKKS